MLLSASSPKGVASSRKGSPVLEGASRREGSRAKLLFGSARDRLDGVQVGSTGRRSVPVDDVPSSPPSGQEAALRP